MMVHQFVCFCLLLLGDLMLTLQQLPMPNLYLKQISSPPNGVSGVYTDEPGTISVMEGDSVTLQTGEIQTNRIIMWTFRLNSSETVIVDIYKQIISIYDSGNNERFRDRLKIDEKTGSLTITNINKLHSGLYKVQMTNETVKHKTFKIAVFGFLTVPVIIRDSSSSSSPSSSNCSLVCSVLNVSDVTLSWYKGISVLSSISVCDLSISLSLPLEIQCLDDSYRCVLNNPIRNQTTHLDKASQLCQPCEESHRTPLLLVSLLLLLLVVAVLVVLFFCRRRKYTQAKQDDQESMSEYTQIIYRLQI
ncbi:T-lymphocyte surface antigen Ly-9-like isoform X2 [Siphateles boraxobius]|uniref:T-lymphocyte surface antigen Ly-9-like isoform X2 n=1 Tax=Siphateles boraxobius TaxID=180520 RepID=UPI0040646723